MRTCTLCGRDTDRSGHPYDGLCSDCDYCRRYGHIDESRCARCGYPRYERPASTPADTGEGPAPLT